MNNSVGAVILAAGKGTRLNCVDKPKVMLGIGGKPIVSYAVETLESMGFSREQIVLVVGFHEEVVRTYFGVRVAYATQGEQKGTAHAAHVGIGALPVSVETVLVMGGDDSAFYTHETLENLVASHMASGKKATLLSVHTPDPTQLGRVVRSVDGHISIVEKEDLTDEQKLIDEVSTGTFCFDREWFSKTYPLVEPLKGLGEYGLPSVFALAQNEGAAQVVVLEKRDEWFGINTPAELAEADKRKMV